MKIIMILMLSLFLFGCSKQEEEKPSLVEAIKKAKPEITQIVGEDGIFYLSKPGVKEERHGAWFETPDLYIKIGDNEYYYILKLPPVNGAKAVFGKYEKIP